MNHLFLLSQAVRRELDQKYSSRDSDHRSYGHSSNTRNCFTHYATTLFPHDALITTFLCYVLKSGNETPPNFFFFFFFLIKTNMTIVGLCGVLLNFVISSQIFENNLQILLGILLTLLTNSFSMAILFVDFVVWIFCWIWIVSFACICDFCQLFHHFLTFLAPLQLNLSLGILFFVITVTGTHFQVTHQLVCRHSFNFCVLIFISSYLPCVYSNSCVCMFVWSLGSYFYKVILSMNRTFLLPPSKLDVLYSFLWLISLTTAVKHNFIKNHFIIILFLNTWSGKENSVWDTCFILKSSASLIHSYISQI